MVASAAGMLPASISPVMRWSTWPWRWCAQAPPLLVTAANHRSVPMATAGFSLNTLINKGVISEPPPTPVMPTMAPMPKPLKTAIQSMCRWSMLQSSMPCEGATVGRVYINQNDK